jgi:cytidylate kinase
MKNENEWIKPREYSFTNAAGEVFHEIAYSRQDVNAFAEMHKATKYKPTEDRSIDKPLAAD